MYNKRTWLNDIDKPSTGSMVSYHGQSDWSEKDICFIELADCHSKIRLHKTDNDTMQEFCRKLRTIANDAELFAKYLESL